MPFSLYQCNIDGCEWRNNNKLSTLVLYVRGILAANHLPSKLRAQPLARTASRVIPSHQWANSGYDRCMCKQILFAFILFPHDADETTCLVCLPRFFWLWDKFIVASREFVNDNKILCAKQFKFRKRYFCIHTYLYVHTSTYL